MTVEFSDGLEPWSVARGGRKLWLHAVADVSTLPGAWRDELTAWLECRNVTEPVESLVLTRGDDGYQVHAPRAPIPVSLAELPVWLQKPTPEPEPAIPARARRK